MKIDLDDYVPGSTFFKWHEVLYCDQWKSHVFPPSLIYHNIIKTIRVMESIRGRLGTPLIITSFYRPPIYNILIKGAGMSQHTLGLACDFKSPIIPPKRIREIIRPELERWNIRMERDTPTWVHIDLKSVNEKDGEAREFYPPGSLG